MSLTITQLRLLALSRRRFVTDAVAWLMFYMMFALILPLVLWHQYEEVAKKIIIENKVNLQKSSINGFLGYILNPDELEETLIAGKRPREIPISDVPEIVRVLLTDIAWFGLWLIPVVYINLFFLKIHFLDRLPPHKWNYVLYLLSVLALCAICAGLMDARIDQVSWVRTDFRFARILMLNFGVALISTGLIYRKELIDKLSWIQGKLEDLESTGEKPKQINLAFTKDHLKVGTKNNHDFIRFEEIIYFEGAGNEPFIWTDRGRFHGNNRMMDYEGLLPKEDFIRIHRSFIIAKKRVLRRKNNEYILRGKDGAEIAVPIGGDSYIKKIEADEYLGKTEMK